MKIKNLIAVLVLFLAALFAFTNTSCGSSSSSEAATASGSVSTAIKKIATPTASQADISKAEGETEACTHSYDASDYAAFGAMSKHAGITKYEMPLVTVALTSTLTTSAPELFIYNNSSVADLSDAAIDLAQGAEAASDILTTQFTALSTQALAAAQDVVADCNAMGYSDYVQNMSAADKVKFPDCASFNQFIGARYDSLAVATDYPWINASTNDDYTLKSIVINGSATYTNGDTVITFYTKTLRDGMTRDDFTTGPAEDMTITTHWFGIEDAKFTTPVAIGSDIQQTVFAVINLTGVLSIEAADTATYDQHYSVGRLVSAVGDKPCVVVWSDYELGPATENVDLLMCVNPPVFSASIGLPSSLKYFQVSDKEYVNVYGYSKLFAAVLDSQNNIISTSTKENYSCTLPVHLYGCEKLYPWIGWAESWTKGSDGKYDFVFLYGDTFSDFDPGITGDQTAEGPFTHVIQSETCGSLKSAGTWIAKEYVE